ncbi:MAG: HAMP domain-containing sensor histidine kinase, partial [Nitratireductor sp.]
RGMTINAQRLRDLFRATEPLAGGKRGSARQYNPVQVVVDTLNLFRSKCEGLGIAVHRKAAPDVDDVSGYREDLSTAVTNLVDNAIYWLEYHGVEQPEITATISTQSGSCIVTISDNGIGIPVEFREHIFDVGFTLKPNGTGLGLSIAREAIGRSGGTIKLLDETDGTSFQIMLPTGGV